MSISIREPPRKLIFAKFATFRMKGTGVTLGHLTTSFFIRILSMIAYCFLTVTLEEQESSL